VLCFSLFFLGYCKCAVNYLERLVSDITYCVLRVTVNYTVNH